MSISLVSSTCIRTVPFQQIENWQEWGGVRSFVFFIIFLFPVQYIGTAPGQKAMYVFLIGGGRGITSQLYSRFFRVISWLQQGKHFKSTTALQKYSITTAGQKISSTLQHRKNIGTNGTYISPPNQLQDTEGKKKWHVMCPPWGSNCSLKVIPMLDSGYNAFDVYYCTYPTTTSLKGLRC